MSSSTTRTVPRPRRTTAAWAEVRTSTRWRRPSRCRPNTRVGSTSSMPPALRKERHTVGGARARRPPLQPAASARARQADTATSQRRRPRARHRPTNSRRSASTFTRPSRNSGRKITSRWSTAIRCRPRGGHRSRGALLQPTPLSGVATSDRRQEVAARRWRATVLPRTTKRLRAATRCLRRAAACRPSPKGSRACHDPPRRCAPLIASGPWARWDLTRATAESHVGTHACSRSPRTRPPRRRPGQHQRSRTTSRPCRSTSTWSSRSCAAGRSSVWRPRAARSSRPASTWSYRPARVTNAS